MLKLLIAVTPGALADLLRQSLSSQFVLHICATAADARRLMKTAQPDVVIIQTRLGVQDGLSVLRSCRHRPRATLVLTDLVNEQILQYAADAGVDALITIPCSAGYVAKTLDRILEKAPAPES